MRIKKYKVFTLFALALLVTSVLLIGMNVSTGAVEPQPIYLHGPSLRPTHMHSNITLNPVHMHSLQPYEEHIDEPISTDWHELYPDNCTDWRLTSWDDTQWPGDPGYGELSPNDQIDMINTDTGETEWYHVDRMTVTLNLSWPYPEPEPPEEEGKIIWFMQVPPEGPEPPLPPENKVIWFVQIPGPEAPPDVWEPITLIEPCGWYRVIATEPYQPDFTPPPCSWWHIFYPEELYCIYFHVDESYVLEVEQGVYVHDFHIDKVLPERRAGEGLPTPTPEPPLLPQAEWIPPIEPITKIAPCKWYRVIDTEPYEPYFTPPPSSWWHIFWPEELYCIYFHVDKSTDHMFHIDKVLPEPIKVDPPVDLGQGEWVTQPVERKFVELKAPQDWLPYMDPTGTLWHEVWPSYSNVYHCIGWRDNDLSSIVDFCDEIDLENTDTGIITTWHVDGISNDLILRWKGMDPIGTWWHELYPEYDKWYNLTGWEVTGEPFESFSARMTEEESGNVTWYSVDRITITINVTSKIDTPEWMMLELKTQYLEEMFYYLKHPLYSLWHEVYPNYSNVYNITWWYPDDPDTDNCNGVLDPCDCIWLQNVTSGEEEFYHIGDMCYDFILNKKITDPVSTTWHELYPEYCKEYHIDAWEDNGDGLLSPCDQINMTLLPGGTMEEYHVENVTLTLTLTPEIVLALPIYVESMLPFEEIYVPKTKPLYTPWHEVYPEFCINYTLTDWQDNCNGVLDYCDSVELMLEPPIDLGIWYHVDDVAIDMVVKKKPVHDVAVIDVFSQYPQVIQGEADPINVTVTNLGDFDEPTVDVYAFCNESLASPKQTTSLNIGQTKTLTFDWNTTGFSLGNYTISANATIPVDDAPGNNYLSDGTQEVIPEFPPAMVLPLFMILSLIAVVFVKLKKKKQ